MNTTETPVNEKALRRWINEDHEGMTITWTLQECMDYAAHFHVHGLDAFRQTPYRSWETYQGATPAARETVDAVFNAIHAVASPLLGLTAGNDSGTLWCSFTWHDGAQYRVEVRQDGALARLYRVELTGAWVGDAITGLVPDATWRTVRAFSKDRAGKCLAPALAGIRGTAAWTRAVEL